MSLELEGQEVKMSDMSEAELQEVIKEILPDDVKNMSDDEIAEMMQNGKRLDDENTYLLETNKKLFGDKYDYVISLFKERVFQMVDDVDNTNSRNKTFELISLMANTISGYEAEDKVKVDVLPGIDTTKEKLKARLIYIVKLAYRHFFLTIAGYGNGSLEHHDIDRLVNQSIYNIYSDGLGVSSLLNNIGTQLEGFEHPETRYLDSNITNAFTIDRVIVGTVLATSKLIDFLITEVDVKEGDNLMDLRNDLFIKIVDEYMVKP